MFINSVYCSYVDTTTAKTVATNFFLSRISQSKQARVKSLSAQKIEIELVHQEFDDSVALNNQCNKDPYYYVYNVKNNNGFIIVSADDAVTPILGYAFEGKYDSINQPPAFIEWMNNFKKQLKSIKITNSKVLSHVKSEWSKIITANTMTNETTSTEVAPLLTTTWSQGCYYNSFCPEAAKGDCGNVPVGCEAVAMAQIINYWKYPNACNDIPGYTSYYGWMPDINSTIYNWANMVDNLTDSTSETKVNAVAELLYHCGVAVQMDYRVEGSGAVSSDAAKALCKYFNYSSSLQYKGKSSYSTLEWKSLLNNELNHGRPLYYDGHAGSSGHAFVCDGYQNLDYYHFNWGWEGRCDGYFYIDNLNPGGSAYNNSQGAIIGISTVSLPVIDNYNYEIKDGGAGGGKGNGNGIAEAGETIELPITLENIGLGTSNNVTATLSCEDVDITITNSSQGWGSIDANSIKIATNYAFNISSSCLVKDIIFTLRITSDEGNWTKVFTIHVYKIKSINLDVAGTLNSLLTPAEKSSITFLTLTGTIDARDFKTMRDSLPLLSRLYINSTTIAAYKGTEGTATYYSITYPANTIPLSAFYTFSTNQGKVTLISVTLPSTITTIGGSAFQNCSGLTGSLTIPSTVTTIGNYAFAYCSGLTGSLTIPSSVTSIGSSAFRNCSGLTSILAYKTTPVNLSSSPLVFDGVNKTTCTLSVPNGTKSTYQAALQWKDFTIIAEAVTALPALNDESIYIYPNPVTDGFQIKGIEGIADFRLIDLYGKLLLQKQVRVNENVSVSTLPTGMYMINISNNGVSYQKKVIKK